MTVNKSLPVPEHVDQNDGGPSYVIFVGKFRPLVKNGGALCLKSGPVRERCGVLYRIPPGEPHWVPKFAGGVRKFDGGVPKFAGGIPKFAGGVPKFAGRVPKFAGVAEVRRWKSSNVFTVQSSKAMITGASACYIFQQTSP